MGIIACAYTHSHTHTIHTLALSLFCQFIPSPNRKCNLRAAAHRIRRDDESCTSVTYTQTERESERESIYTNTQAQIGKSVYTHYLHISRTRVSMHRIDNKPEHFKQATLSFTFRTRERQEIKILTLQNSTRRQNATS